VDSDFIPNFDSRGANNNDAFNFADALNPSTARLLEVTTKLPDFMETADICAAYLVDVVAPALHEAISQPEQTITQADALAVSQTLMAVFSIALSAGQSRGTIDIAAAISAMTGGR
jgi:hypothetical protein